MISSVQISNFLSHESTSLEFSKGVNVIVGPTDSGKSAVIKALKWVITNRPLGDGMRSSWGGATAVELVVDGTSVVRGKDTGINFYKIFGKALNGQFNAIKGDIPEEVAKVLDLTDINLQTQFDSHFLLSKSPGEVAQIFNRIAHLDKIGSGLQNIQRWTRDVQRKIDFNGQSLETARERLLSYECLDEIDRRLLELEEIDTALKRQQSSLSILSKICDQIQSVEEELQEVGFLEELEASVDYLLGVFSELKEVQNNFTVLLAKVASVNAVEKLLKETDEKLATYEEEFHEALGEGSVCPLCGSVIE